MKKSYEPMPHITALLGANLMVDGRDIYNHLRHWAGHREKKKKKKKKIARERMNQGTVNLMTQKKCINSAFDTRIIINNRKKKIDIIGYNSTVNTKSEHVTTKTRKNSDQHICE